MLKVVDLKGTIKHVIDLITIKKIHRVWNGSTYSIRITFHNDDFLTLSYSDSIEF